MKGHDEALELERATLARVLGIARGQLHDAEQSEARHGAAMTETRRDMREQTEQKFGNLWASDDFEALANLNQFAQPLAVGEMTREMRLEKIRTLRNMLEAPYFARIDLAYEGESEAEAVYIGRATLKDEVTHQLYIHDWRSPVASVFYRFGRGPAHYEAPGGRIDCDMTLKRQFEIRHGALEYFFDADVEVQDRFLRAMLSQNASPRMKAIVETIQRDQDLAIRDTEHELMMVQGAAGSGKSSIALHRVAYLMYEGLSSPLSAGDIVILSPNALFERYIHGVLPELGERSVETVTLEQLLSGILGGVKIEARGERFERLCLSGPEERTLLRESMAFKSSEAFLKVLDRFVRELPRRWIDFQDVNYGGRTIATRQRLKERAMRPNGAVPLGVELRRMEISLWDGIHQRKQSRIKRLIAYARRNPRHATEIGECARAYSILECWALRRHIRSFTRLDPLSFYRRLISDEAAFRRLAKGLDLPENLKEILKRTSDALIEKSLSFEDATAVAYLALCMEGAGRTQRIRQVVVDEAQDYDPAQYAVLNRLFPRARFTVLGDFNQALDRKADKSLYDRIAQTLNRRSALMVELNKSFRCTREILDFSLRFLDDPTGIQSFNRGGEAPVERAAKSQEELKGLIAEDIRSLREKGMDSIALIVKTNRDAQDWYARLKDTLDIGLIDSKAAAETVGAFVIPLQLAKGLEFDAVLVLDVDQYDENTEKRLLYVACTRALHHLSLYRLETQAKGGVQA